MASEIRLPELTETGEEGTIVEIAVKVGDTVNEGDTLVEVEAGKSTVPVPAPMNGKIVEVLVNQGDPVETNQVICKIEAGEGASGGEDVSMPPVNEQQNEPPAASPAPPSAPQPERQNGTGPQPSGMPANRMPGTMPGERSHDPAGVDEPDLTYPKPARQAPERRFVPAAPATRQLARELGVDLSRVQGTARNGRVTQEDIKKFVRQLNQQGPSTAAGTGIEVPPLPDFSKHGEIDAQPLDQIRKVTAKQMGLAWAAIPHVTQHDLADITDLEAFRKQRGKERDVKLTVTAFALKASAIALHEFPKFNTSLDLPHNQLIYKKYYHIGIAVDTDNGLLVPVIKDVDKKSVFELAGEMNAIADRARQRKHVDLAGGTFTITNLGGIGGVGFTPIVNWPQVAILGMSRARQEAVFQEDGSVKPRLMLPLSLSYDHRVIDGADAARFVRRLVELLENPLVMLLHA
ncbi:MAG: 2-oxo acid dehydrogenase subunit E2 [Gemmataceae bacterium]